MGFLKNILNGVTTIGSFLSIFFKFPKISISLKRFILLFAAVCLLFILIISLCNMHNKDETLNDETPTYSDDKRNEEKSGSNFDSSNREKIVELTPIENEDVNYESRDEVNNTVNNTYNTVDNGDNKCIIVKPVDTIIRKTFWKQRLSLIPEELFFFVRC